MFAIFNIIPADDRTLNEMKLDYEQQHFTRLQFICFLPYFIYSFYIMIITYIFWISLPMLLFSSNKNMRKKNEEQRTCDNYSIEDDKITNTIRKFQYIL